MTHKCSHVEVRIGTLSEHFPVPIVQESISSNIMFVHVQCSLSDAHLSLEIFVTPENDVKIAM